MEVDWKWSAFFYGEGYGIPGDRGKRVSIALLFIVD
jgi:hypothetical protein